MKILRIVSSGFELGGIETHVALLEAAQKKRGYIIKTFSSDDRPDLPHFNDYSYKTPAGWNKFIYGTFNPYAFGTLKKVLKDFKPDVVDIHSIGHASPAILFLLKKYPTVLTVHGPEGYTKSLIIWCFPPSYFKNEEYDICNLRLMGKVRYFYHQTIGRAMYRVGLRNINNIVTLSRYMHHAMENEGLKNDYVPMGIKLFAYKPFRETEVPHTLAYMGRLEKTKGIDYLINAMPAIIERFPDTKLFIAGDGARRGQLEELIREINIQDHVTFFGHLDRDVLEKLYGQASIVIMPSANPETFGKVGVEAMSVGRPVIATEVGGVSDWLSDGENGILVPPRDADAIANGVIRLFSDTSLIMSMSKKARAKAEEFELELHIQQMEKVYNAAIDQELKKRESQ